MKSIPCNVFRNNSGDCTLGGISSKEDRVLLVWDVKPNEEIPEKIDGLSVLGFSNEILKGFGEIRQIGAFPLDSLKFQKSGRWYMFGGNFLYTSDSRFPYDHPVKIFDRCEG
jgi:hypothetical protein